MTDTATTRPARHPLTRKLIHRMPEEKERVEALEPLSTREWLVTNGLGGYASGTVSGVVTRRYHGLLTAALPSPWGRMVMLSEVSEIIRLPDGKTYRLSGNRAVADQPAASSTDTYLTSFRLEAGLPVWHYEVGGAAMEKMLLLAYGQNTVYVIYRLLSGPSPIRLKVLLAANFRAHEAPVSTPLPEPFKLCAVEDRYELSATGNLPLLRMMFYGRHPAFTSEPRKIPAVLYPVEESRGYQSQGDLWSPGYFRADLAPDQDATLVASTEDWETVRALDPGEAEEAELERRRRLLSAAHPCARGGVSAELVVAADQFIIQPAGRARDAARVRAAGAEARTVIAGYHWFTDWGRDTMISLEGLALLTGRQAEAAGILRTFSYYIRDGLIPNLFPEGENEGLYHTADATLWFFHAVHRYWLASGDRDMMEYLLPKFQEIVEHHVKGTRFGIGVDPADDLLRQGAEGYQLTWMDAKVGDWVVTPRRGKAVEINALWYNALRLLEDWVREFRGEDEARPLAERAERVYTSFNRRFWYEAGGYLYDVVDGEHGGDDSSCRPNQIFAVSLDHPVLDPARWPAVVQVVHDRLLTPVGLRSLAPGSPDYKPKYYGDLRSRDAAYHQGTVWAWLIGPFIDAWLRVHPDDFAGARRFLEGFTAELDQSCIGSINEIFDAEKPYTPRGCIAQAWSVAEVLRSWVKTGCTPESDGEPAA